MRTDPALETLIVTIAVFIIFCPIIIVIGLSFAELIGRLLGDSSRPVYQYDDDDNAPSEPRVVSVHNTAYGIVKVIEGEIVKDAA